jgi:ubiquinone biosynthesis protein
MCPAPVEETGRTGAAMSTVSAGFRLVRAGWVLVREGVVAALPGEELSGLPKFGWRLARLFTRRRALAYERSDRLAKAVVRLGPSYVKLGQFLATRPDVVGNDMALDLAMLQDKMHTFPKAEAVAAIELSLGRKVGDLYAQFGDPVAAASIAQVHAADTIHDGVASKVAVKVIRPGVRRRFFHDLESYFLAARLQEKYIPSSRRLRPVEVTETLAQTTRIEMDLRLEAAALSELGENTRDDPGFRVPSVDWERTGRDVLTMEWVDGVKMNDIAGLEAAGHDLKAIATNLIQSFLRHTLRDGFFHADMHPGNLFVEANGTIVAVDLGIAGRLGKKERHFLAEILYGFITRDYLRVAEVHFEAGYVPRQHNVAAFAQAIRAIGEPIHGQPAETISMAKLLTLLFEVTELFDMATRPELILLQKTMVVVEGVARTLDPAFNMWKTAEPVVGGWISGNLGPRGMMVDLRDSAKALLTLARQAPELATRTERLSREIDLMAEHGLRFDETTAHAIGKAEARYSRSGRLALWVIALTLVYIAWKLI